ncbi:MAG: metallophosphoesterase [Sandaracinaceae bacterium]|nr:metallophosphoesterase [Sandaracinaceae bacterium]
MLTFSHDPKIAEQQMDAMVFSLTTFGYIDGDFDDAEKDFVRDYIRKLVTHRVDTGMPNATPAVREDLVARFTTHFLEKFEAIDAHVRELFTEPIAEGDDRNLFVHAKLKQRCFEIFQAFDRASQDAILETVDELIHADGHVHPAEAKFRSELAGLLGAELDIELIDSEDDSPRASITTPIAHKADGDHPFFKQFEHHYSADPAKISKQVAADLALVDRMVDALEERRQTGNGKLDGKRGVAELEPGARFLDGWVHVVMPEPGRAYELLVLGDLHGCYSCLKGALMQDRFFEKVEAYRRAPDASPYPLLVLLGDYIDRGIFSLNGVLRAVLQLATTAPEHVIALRGNHEYYVEVKGNIYGGVRPAEAINTLKPHLPIEVFRNYMRLFDALPNYLLFGRTFFVHGGIPRDRTIKERWKDLSSLNDADLRFQAMWSDPSSADVIPAALQEQTARFPFGRLQFQSFMQRLGCRTLVRGHEKVDEGFRRVYDDEAGLLVTLFSAGGKTNADLPEESSYRSVTPMALRLHHGADGTSTLTPMAIDWESFNDPDRNAFFQKPLEIEHKAD